MVHPLLSLLVLVCLFATSIDAFAQKTESQEPLAPDTLHIGVELVQIDVVVTDEEGNRVKGLRPEDFEIYEDGRLQEISNFSYVERTGQPAQETRPPAESPAVLLPPRRYESRDVRRVFAFVVDDLFISFENVVWTKSALRKFVDTQMQPGDLVAIIMTSRGTGSLQQFTSDTRLLHAAIDRIRFNPRGAKGHRSFDTYGEDLAAFNPFDRKRAAQGDVPSQPRSRPDLAEEANARQDEELAMGSLGALDFVVRSLRELPGRKSLVWLTEGFPLVTQDPKGKQELRVLDTMRQFADRTNRAGVTIYPIDTRGLVNPYYVSADVDPFEDRPDAGRKRIDSYLDSQDVMRYLAHHTGGFVNTANDPLFGIRRAVEDQESYYFIGYVPDSSSFRSDAKDAEFHQIEVRVKRPGLRVRSRSGFIGYTDARSTGDAKSPSTRLAEAMLSPIGGGAIDLGLSAQFLIDENQKLSVRSVLRVDASDLTFAEAGDGKAKATFDVVAFTAGETGAMEGIVYESKILQVPSAEVSRIREQGLVFALNLPIKGHGPYHVRAAIRDAVTDRIGSANEFLVVPDLSKRRLAVSGLMLRSAQMSGSTSAQLKPGSELEYLFTIYNGTVKTGAGRPNLTMRLALWRDGQRVLEGRDEPLSLASQTDWSRINTVGRMKLSPRIAPGIYTLQIDITDLNASKKHSTATQWIDFEVVANGTGR